MDFQRKREDAIRSVTLADLYLSILCERIATTIYRSNHQEAYERAQRLVWRIRLRHGEQCTLADCSFSALSLWSSKQRQWRDFDAFALQLERDFPALSEDVKEHCHWMLRHLDDPNKQC